MAQIIIRRRSQWTNGLRAMGLYVDGSKIGTIYSNETEEFEVSEGSHVLTEKIDWFSSQEYRFYVYGNQNVQFELFSKKGSTWLFPVLAVFLLIHFLLHTFTSWTSGVISGFFWGMFVGGLINFGVKFFVKRNEYLVLKNDSLLTFTSPYGQPQD